MTKKLFACLFVIVLLFSVQGVFAQELEKAPSGPSQFQQGQQFLPKSILGKHLQQAAKEDFAYWLMNRGTHSKMGTSALVIASALYNLERMSLAFSEASSEEQEEIEKFLKELQKEVIVKITEKVDKYSYDKKGRKRYQVYFTPKEWEDNLESMHYEGIGIVIGDAADEPMRQAFDRFLETLPPEILNDDDLFKKRLDSRPDLKDYLVRRLDENRRLSEKGIVVLKVFPDSGAEKAGLKDHIGWFINGVVVGGEFESFEGLTFKQATDLIKGESGTSVVLKLEDPENGSLRDIIIKKSDISRSRMETKMISDKIGYLKINSFHFVDNVTGKGSIAEALKKAEEKLKSLGAEMIVLDLRDNPGGSLAEADQVLDRLLPPGRVETHVEYVPSIQNIAPGGTYYSSAKKKVPKVFEDWPMIVLGNRNSASASDLIIGALKEHKRAIFVGETTFGKGTIQRVFPLADGSFMKFTAGKFVSPVSEESPEGKGIEPHILATDDKNTEEDEVIEEVKNIFNSHNWKYYFEKYLK